MTSTLTDPVELRRWAAHCGNQATNLKLPANEREHLLKMQQALNDLANTNDWLDGKRSYLEFNFQETGPVNPNAA